MACAEHHVSDTKGGALKDCLYLRESTFLSTTGPLPLWQVRPRGGPRYPRRERLLLYNVQPDLADTFSSSTRALPSPVIHGKLQTEGTN